MHKATSVFMGLPLLGQCWTLPILNRRSVQGRAQGPRARDSLSPCMMKYHMQFSATMRCAGRYFSVCESMLPMHTSVHKVRS